MASVRKSREKKVTAMKLKITLGRENKNIISSDIGEILLIDANVSACRCAGNLYRSAQNVSQIEKLLMKICTKDK